MVVSTLFFTGCASSRTGSIGYEYEKPVVTVNTTETVVTSTAANGDTTVTSTKNIVSTSTPPVQKRTWRERAFGQRPPTQDQVIPASAESGAKSKVLPRRERPRYYQSPSYGSYGGSYGGGWSRPAASYIPRSSGISVGGGVSNSTTLPTFHFNRW